ncbi:MAG: FKBP-type peptidyl-prolyl cis-trans isomerase [Chlamydiales bacterium]
MNTNREKASYCIGLETGKQLRNQFKEMDIQFLVDGLRDGFSASQPKLSQEEMTTILNALRQQIETQQKQFVAQLAADNKKKGEEFLSKNQKVEGVQTLPSGLQYKVLTEGSGPTPTLLDMVTVHYRGYFIDGTEFESTYTRGKPTAFPVNQVIPGWTETLQKMKVGGKWRIFIPSYLAYGEMGYGRDIEPNTTLIFDMELLSIGGET